LSEARVVKKAYADWEALIAANPPGLEELINKHEQMERNRRKEKVAKAAGAGAIVEPLIE